MSRSLNLLPGTTRHGLTLPAVLLFLLSLAAAELAVIARAKLWLGPQTVILGGIGLGVAVTIALVARTTTRAAGDTSLDHPLLSRGMLVALIVICTLAAAIICRFAFGAFPNSADEYGFLFQARTFMHGRLWNAVPPDPILFAQNYLIDRDGMWISQYLPGWPAILAVFEAMALPPWLGAPVCGAGLLLMLWAALRMECASKPLIGMMLLGYASTGFFLLNASTYFSHCASALLVVGSIVCMLRMERHDGWHWPVLAGGFVGYAILTRIDSGLLAGIAVVAAWGEQGFRRRTFLLGLAGGAPFIALFCAYNAIVTGNPLILPTMWAGNLHIGANGLSGVEQQSAHLRMLVQTMWRLGGLADTASLLLPALYFAAMFLKVRSRHLRFYDLVPLANFVMFLIFPDLGGFQMGPRYWFDGFAVMQITVASAFAETPVATRRFAMACILLLVPVSLARLPSQVAFEAHVMHERSSVFRLAQALPAGQKSIVLVHDFYSTWNDRYNRTAPNFAKDFVRNGIRLDRPVLFARGDVPDALARACSLYPTANMYSFQLDPAHPEGWLQPMNCTAARRVAMP